MKRELTVEKKKARKKKKKDTSNSSSRVIETEEITSIRTTITRSKRSKMAILRSISVCMQQHKES